MRAKEMSDVRFGSLAVVNVNVSLMSASGGKADVKNAEMRDSVFRLQGQNGGWRYKIGFLLEI